MIAGFPRSGSTWIGEALGRTGGASYLHEPDNDQIRPTALRAKRGLGHFPVLGPDDPAPSYARLWDASLTSVERDTPRARASRAMLRSAQPAEISAAVAGRPATGRIRVAVGLSIATPRRRVEGPLVVKSVQAPLALEWIAARWRPRILIVVRHPLNALASWLELRHLDPRLDESSRVMEHYVQPWGIPLPPSDASSVGRLAWQIGLLTGALRVAAGSHPEWTIVEHEALCVDPGTTFPRLAYEMGLRWSESAERFLVESNRPGGGMGTDRLASDQSDRWRRRLAADQVAEATAILAVFPPEFGLA